MTNIEVMTAAYIEAIYFTETGNTDQPPATARITPLSRCQAYLDCRNFMAALGLHGGAYAEAIEGYDTLPWKHVGHDLWLTRNCHGTGFWDRDSLYTPHQADLFCRIAKALGPHDVEFIEE